MAIGSQQNQIFNLGILSLLGSIDKIFKMSLALARNFQAHGEGLARSGALVRILLRQVTVRIAARIRPFGGVRAGAIGDSLFYSRIIAFRFGCEVAIGLAFCDQFVSSLTMLVRVGRLKNDLFIVSQTQPLQALDNRSS